METNAIDNIEVVALETQTSQLVPLKHGEFLVGEVTKGFFKDNELLGAVLAFAGREGTALLHLRQMTGVSPVKRLADLSIGDPVKVRIMVTTDGDKEKVWATEKGLEYQEIVDLLASDRDRFKSIDGRVHGLTEFGVFIELLAGPASGHRALLRIGASPNSGRIKLGAFMPFKVGAPVVVDVVEARVDDNAKLLLRVENVQLMAASVA
jgi:predicted RNA-binding protein with RPS1 domain